MSKNAAITIRMSEALKKRLEARARNRQRSLSAQVVKDLEAILENDPRPAGGGSFLGHYRGSRLPTDEDFRKVRALLWGKLGASPAAND